MYQPDQRHLLCHLLLRSARDRLPLADGWGFEMEALVLILAAAFERSRTTGELARAVPFPHLARELVQLAVSRGLLSSPDAHGRHSVTEAGGGLLDRYSRECLIPCVLSPTEQLIRDMPKRATAGHPFYSVPRAPQTVALGAMWRQAARTKLDLVRRLVGVTHKELRLRVSSRAPMSLANLKRTLSGERAPTVPELQALGSALGIEEWYLLAEDPPDGKLGDEGDWLRLLG